MCPSAPSADPLSVPGINPLYLVLTLNQCVLSIFSTLFLPFWSNSCLLLHAKLKPVLPVHLIFLPVLSRNSPQPAPRMLRATLEVEPRSHSLSMMERSSQTLPNMFSVWRR